jgi:hypothetical protein
LWGVGCWFRFWVVDAVSVLVLVLVGVVGVGDKPSAY